MAVKSVVVAPLLFLVTQGDIPKGFRPTEESVPFDREGEVGEWHVSQDEGVFRIERQADWVKRMDDEATQRKRKPGSRQVKLANATAIWQPGDGVRAADGWVQGFDAGEFGGGLFWFSSDGKVQRAIDDHNTEVVVRLPSGIFAVQSLTHLMFWYSRLVRVERNQSGWTSIPVTDLHVAPNAVVQDGSRLLYATNEYVSTLEGDGRQREIFRPVGRFSPRTMVRRPNGDVWIGGNDAIVRLRPKPNGDYAAQWFLPLK